MTAIQENASTASANADAMSESHQPADPEGRLDRRGLIRTAATAGAVVVAGAGLAACSSSAGSGGSGTSTSSAASGAGSNSASSSGPAAGGGGSQGTSGALASTADIPVGGGKIFADQNVVVTQPKAGTFKAFSAVCTHQGCQVSQISNGTIDCPCHGSQFSIVDGSVRHGPARQPLPTAAITVQGNAITLKS